MKQQIARKSARIILQAKACLYSQWFAGVINVGSDSLSRDCIIIFLLQNYAHTQVLKNLNIKPLPKDIVSFIGSTLQQLSVQQYRLKQAKISEFLRGVAGTLSLSVSDMNIAFTSMAFKKSNNV